MSSGIHKVGNRGPGVLAPDSSFGFARDISSGLQAEPGLENLRTSSKLT